jgi:hypothetical protein
LIAGYILSINTDFRFCIVNNTIGEFYFELAALIFFGMFTTIWLLNDIIQIEG